jgi:translation initiation factor IF-3
VIDENETQLGVLDTQDALKLARERDLDLVEVAPQAEPPVCRLLDYGRFRYMQAKKEKESRKSQKYTLLREVRFRPRIGQHDLDAKTRLVSKLLVEGAKVKVSVMFRGREMTHPELGMSLLRRVAASLKDTAKVESAPSMEGRFMGIILAPAPSIQKKIQDKTSSDETESDLKDAKAQDS